MNRLNKFAFSSFVVVFSVSLGAQAVHEWMLGFAYPNIFVPRIGDLLRGDRVPIQLRLVEQVGLTPEDVNNVVRIIDEESGVVSDSEEDCCDEEDESKESEGDEVLDPTYKTELCRGFKSSQSCKNGDKCRFAHGEGELRNRKKPKSYKKQICNKWKRGVCKYGRRCHFAHGKHDLR